MAISIDLRYLKRRFRLLMLGSILTDNVHLMGNCQAVSYVFKFKLLQKHCDCYYSDKW